MKEIEIKIKLDDAEALIKKVEGLGGKKLKEEFQHDVMFDNGKGFFDGENCLRLRFIPDDSWYLTLKNKPSDHGYLLTRKELETKIEDGEIMDLILRDLGFFPHRIKEKNATYYDLDGVHVRFDRMPFLGDFIEIEAAEDEIKKIVERLGLSLDQGINTDYTSLFHKFLKERNCPLETPQTFEEEKKWANGQKPN